MKLLKNKMIKKAVIAAALCGIMMFSGCGTREGTKENKAGLAYYEAGEYEKAVASYDEAIAKSADYAEYYVNKAYAEIGLGNLEDAKNAADLAITQEDADGYTYRCAGIVSYNRGEYEDAISYFKTAIDYVTEDDPDEDAVRDLKLYMAEAYEKSDDPGTAIIIYTELISTNEKDAEAYYLRGKCYAAMEDMDTALQDFEALRALAPAKMSYYIDIYEILCEDNRETEGLEYLESAVKLSPKTADEKKNHGIIQYLLGNYSEAQSELGNIAEDDRDDNTWLYLGLTEAALGNDDAAETDYEMALAHTDSRAKVYYHLAMLEMKLGQYSGALKDIEDGLAENDSEMTQKLAYAQVVALERSTDYAGALEKLTAYRDTYGTTDEIDHEIAWLQTR